MTFADVWKDLEDDRVPTGDVRRRVHPDALADLFLVVHRPSNQRGLLIDVDLTGVEIGELPSGRGIELRWVPSSSGGRALELLLSQTAFADLFDALVSDVAGAAATAANADGVAARVAARVRQWQTFLRETSTGLSGERQRGLYGELLCLRRTLIPLVGESAVEAWIGPLAAAQDFGFGEIAVEVKTTMADQHQVLRISSERQLDTTALRHLALFHLSVDGREGAGQTLPELVGQLREQLAAGPFLNTFEDRLFAGGYTDLHASKYLTGYTVRETNLFEVRDGFPRLTERDCPSGVGDVAYSVAVSALTDFRIDAPRLRTMLEVAADGH